MNDEIKEILEQFNKIFDMNIGEDETTIDFTIDESKQILDYITNLQQENERLEFQIEYANKINNEAINRKNKYKSRIERAVEYIEKSKEINYKTIDTLSEEVKLLKGILNGENVMLNNILNTLNGKE